MFFSYQKYPVCSQSYFFIPQVKVSNNFFWLLQQLKFHYLQHNLLNLMSVAELFNPTNQQISLCKEIYHSLILERLSE